MPGRASRAPIVSFLRIADCQLNSTLAPHSAQPDECRCTGEVIAHAVSHLGLGRIVGRRTWGGVACNFISLELVDGSAVAVPDWRVWMDGAGYGLENKGFEPHVEVHNTPMDCMRGVDKQLETAVDEALALLENAPKPAGPGQESAPPARATQRGAAWAFETFAPIGELEGDDGRHTGRYL